MENNEIKDAAQSQKEDIKEEKATEEVLENKVLLEYTDEEIKNKHTFVNTLLAQVMDQAAVLCISAIVLLAFSFFIKFAGYMVVEPVYVLFIIYGIVNCIYRPAFKNSKLKKSVGEKIFNI